MPFLTSLPITFPTYIIPSLPFRRSSSTSTASSNSSSRSSSDASSPTSASASATAGDTAYLPEHNNTTSLLRCNRCLAHLSPTSSIISKGFTGRHGRAYLVSSPPSSLPTAGPGGGGGTSMLPNTTIHKPQQRQLVTGMHTVCDVSCALCGSVLGWKYVGAEEEGQKYKVGKFILETKRVVRDAVWDDNHLQTQDEGIPGSAVAEEGCIAAEEAVEFDSQDEDECEDLFMGVWSPRLAAKRRRDRAWRVNA